MLENSSKEFEEKNKLEAERSKEEIAKKDKVVDDLQRKLENLSKDLTDDETSNELQRLRTIAQDGEKLIKKMTETHKKEMKDLERAKINAEENLNSAIQENTKIKEKEGTMYEILNGLRKLLDQQEQEVGNKDSSTQENNEEGSSDNGASTKANNGAVGGAKPKDFSCQKCSYISSNMNTLNKHMRNEHLSTSYPCVKCDIQMKSTADLKEHEHNVHGNGDNQSQNKKTQFQHQCVKCSFVGLSNEILLQHQSEKHSEQTNCDSCDFIANSRSTLDEQCYFWSQGNCKKRR